MATPLERIGHQARLRKVRLHIEALREGDGDQLPDDLDTVRMRFNELRVSLPVLDQARVWSAIESGIAGEDQSGVTEAPDHRC